MTKIIAVKLGHSEPLLKIIISSAFLSLYIMLLFPVNFHALAAGENKDQIEIIESNLSRERQQYEKFDSREKDLLIQVSELEQDVSEKREAIDELGKKICLSKREIRNLEKKQTRLRNSLQDTEIKAAKRLVTLYKYARNGYIKTMAEVMDMRQLWQRMIYLKAISEEDRKELTKLSEEALNYKRSISKTRGKIAEKEAEGKKESARLVALREDLEERVIRLMRIHKEKGFYETAVKELQLAALDLKQTFSKIEKKKQYNTTWFSRFSGSRGKLPFPLEGKIIRGNKFLRSKTLNFNNGVFIEGSGTEVKAVFPGRVDFSGRLKGYGEIVIVNHGSRYFTVSAQLSERIKEEGDSVESGDAIGLVSQDGSSKKARVYFEIRKAGKNLDPLRWLKKR